MNVFSFNFYVRHFKKGIQSRYISNCVINTVARVLNVNVKQTISIYRTNKTNKSKQNELSKG